MKSHVNTRKKYLWLSLQPDVEKDFLTMTQNSDPIKNKIDKFV